MEILFDCCLLEINFCLILFGTSAIYFIGTGKLSRWPYFMHPCVIVNFISLMLSQAAQDGVDVLSLSITPNRRPPGVATFFNPIDMALLSAVKAGIFVVQAAGNTGPSPKSMSSFSPWIFTVGAASHDRLYSNSMILGNNVTIPGVGLACKRFLLIGVSVSC